MIGHAAVVGGGVSGLVAARQLAVAGWQVTVLEASARFGGDLGAAVVDGVRVDTGAESVLARRPEAVGLITELGLADRLVHPTGARPEVLIEGRPRPLPPSVLGVPSDLDALRDVLSAEGLARARREPDLPGPPLTGDVAVGKLVDDRLGPEVTDRLVEPLLGGVYAGRARELSFAATSAGLFERYRAGGSLIAAARASARPDDGSPVFAGLVGGIASLVDALVDDLGRRSVRLRTSTPVSDLRADSSGYRVACGATPMAEILPVDAVVLAAPARSTGRLLRSLDPVGEQWERLPYASLAVVTLVVQGLTEGPSGLLVPPGELPTVKALTYSSTKWDWVRESAGRRWGEGTAVVRASVGRRGEEALLQLPDEALLRRTFAEVAGLPGWATVRLVTGQVTRWGGALPQYEVGHRDRVAALRRALADRPGLAVAGAALDGVGIAACIGSATLAVDKITADWRSRRQNAGRRPA